MTLSLMKSVKQPFFEIISKCLAIGSLDLVGVGLSTLTWLSFSLPRLPAPKFHPLTLSDLISLLKACLQNSMLVEHKILASTCLLNLSKIAGLSLLFTLSLSLVCLKGVILVIQYVLVTYHEADFCLKILYSCSLIAIIRIPGFLWGILYSFVLIVFLYKKSGLIQFYSF